MITERIRFSTTAKQQLVDITSQLRAITKKHPEAGLMAVYAKGATAAIMIQENWDQNITSDIISCLNNLVPSGCWSHDQIDGNADAHIKSGIVGPSETIPLNNGEMMLSQWQNVFFCDFDGPRSSREVVVTLLF